MKIKYLYELIDDLLESDDDYEVQKEFLLSEIREHRLELLKIEVQNEYKEIERWEQLKYQQFITRWELKGQRRVERRI